MRTLSALLAVACSRTFRSKITTAGISWSRIMADSEPEFSSKSRSYQCCDDGRDERRSSLSIGGCIKDEAEDNISEDGL